MPSVEYRPFLHSMHNPDESRYSPGLQFTVEMQEQLKYPKKDYANNFTFQACGTMHECLHMHVLLCVLRRVLLRVFACVY